MPMQDRYKLNRTTYIARLVLQNPNLEALAHVTKIIAHLQT